MSKPAILIIVFAIIASIFVKQTWFDYQGVKGIAAAAGLGGLFGGLGGLVGKALFPKRRDGNE